MILHSFAVLRRHDKILWTFWFYVSWNFLFEALIFNYCRLQLYSFPVYWALRKSFNRSLIPLLTASSICHFLAWPPAQIALPIQMTHLSAPCRLTSILQRPLNNLQLTICKSVNEKLSYFTFRASDYKVTGHSLSII